MSTEEENEKKEAKPQDGASEQSPPAAPAPAPLPTRLSPTPATVNPTNPPPDRLQARPIPTLSSGGGRPTFGSGAPVPQTQLDQLGRPKVDKYFGSKLPPVCRQLGCYVTDDGKYYYCINPHCHKDRKRETKYNRRRKSLVYFFCPKCKSREIQLHLKKNQYECLECAYAWKN